MANRNEHDLNIQRENSFRSSGVFQTVVKTLSDPNKESCNSVGPYNFSGNSPATFQKYKRSLSTAATDLKRRVEQNRSDEGKNSLSSKNGKDD